jgi:hypothetical protein
MSPLHNGLLGGGQSERRLSERRLADKNYLDGKITVRYNNPAAEPRFPRNSINQLPALFLYEA